MPKKDNAKARGTKEKFLTEHSKNKKKDTGKKTNKRLEIKW